MRCKILFLLFFSTKLLFRNFSFYYFIYNNEYCEFYSRHLRETFPRIERTFHASCDKISRLLRDSFTEKCVKESLFSRESISQFKKKLKCGSISRGEYEETVNTKCNKQDK